MNRKKKILPAAEALSEVSLGALSAPTAWGPKPAAGTNLARARGPPEQSECLRVTTNLTLSVQGCCNV
jgi:hypothetical protein